MYFLIHVNEQSAVDDLIGPFESWESASKKLEELVAQEHGSLNEQEKNVGYWWQGNTNANWSIHSPS